MSLLEKNTTEIPPGFAVYDPLLAKLLLTRNIDTLEEADLFLNPDYLKHVHDPFLLPNMAKAVERIERAIKNNEGIVIWSDYDTDGIPGAVVLHDYFKKIGYKNFKNYIPHRIREGFGLNVSGVEELAGAGANLIITVDCGITDREPVAKANALGVDVIITDHHLPSGDVPHAFAIVNPKLPDNKYPYDMLCGAAVAWKLVSALVSKNSDIPAGWEKWLLDMVGIATLSDMVPLRGENRVLAKYGLLVLRKSRRPGLQRLCRKLQIRQNSIVEDDIGFMIAPRINAASRMGIPEDALRLLATDDEVEAGMLVDHLDKINNERKGHVAAMVKEAKGKLKERDEVLPVIVMGNPDWKPSLLGLVANTLMNEYGRPVFLWGREDGEIIKGSCRSDGSVNLVALMGEVRDQFIDAGGHAFSGGFSVENEKVFWLEEKLNEAYTRIAAAGFGVAVPRKPDAELELRDVGEKTWRMLESLAPFGESNHKPQFLFNGCEVEEIKMFGKAKEHLSLMLKQQNIKVEAIAFFTTPESFKSIPQKGKQIDCIGTIEKSFFGGRTTMRLRIIDVV